MKKQLVIALGLTVLATPAFATKARLQALGEDTYGSFYVNDNRNIWLNAAQINNHKDLVTFEWGNSVSATTNNGQDSNATPRAEGGVYKSIGNLVYGVHFGGASNTANALRAGSGLSLNEAAEKNNLDVFVGGDAGLKWGANLGYSNSGDASQSGIGNAHQESMRTRLGVIAGDIEGYANINLMNNAKDVAGSKFQGKLGYQVGAIYNLNDYRIFADYRQFDATNTFAAAPTKQDQSLSQLLVGVGRATRLNDKATLFTKVQGTYAKASNDRAGTTNFTNGCSSNAATGCKDYKTLQVPVVVGLEYDATSWLVLRGSVSQSVWGSEEDTNHKRSLAETTAVNAGATLKFGEFSVDGVIGNSTNTGAVAGTTGNSSNVTSNSTAGGNGALRTDVLMTRVGMTYRF